MSKFMKAMRILGDDTLETGVGAMFKTDQETEMAFNSLKTFAVEEQSAVFMVDLWCENEGVLDIVFIDAKTYTCVTGQPVLSDEEYAEITNRMENGE
jgi:hypothetical protein